MAVVQNGEACRPKRTFGLPHRCRPLFVDASFQVCPPMVMVLADKAAVAGFTQQGAVEVSHPSMR
jgi:hypothetical protein